ncbi:MAG TPA: hypothetical protein VMW27_20900 [Thermoanaerobaculia bacterium]|nr:hypothetical protein [Thermoanaerobaculia bacterium]
MEKINAELENAQQVAAPEHAVTKTDSCPACLSGIDPTVIGDGFAEILQDLA